MCLKYDIWEQFELEINFKTIYHCKFSRLFFYIHITALIK